MQGIKKQRTYPPWTVPEEICKSGKLNPNCPYNTFYIPETLSDPYADLPNPEDMKYGNN